MDAAVLLARAILAAVFAIAGLAKALRRIEFRRTLADFGLPAVLVPTFAVALPAAELLSAALLLSPRASHWGAAIALGLLTTFIVAISVNLWKGRRPDCRCFGQLRPARVGAATLARNAVLASCAGLVLAAEPGQGGGVGTGLAALLGVSPSAMALGAATLVVLAAESLFSWQLYTQQGRLWLRLDEVERRFALPSAPRMDGPASGQGLPVGSPAPSLEVTGLSGARVPLDTLFHDATPVLLLFSDPQCHPCAALLPEVERWQTTYRGRLRVVVLSHGSEEANRRVAELHQLADVLIQPRNEVSDAYGVNGTPAAVLVRADGTVGTGVAMGREAIVDLLRRFGEGAFQSPSDLETRSVPTPGRVSTHATTLR